MPSRLSPVGSRAAWWTLTAGQLVLATPAATNENSELDALLHGEADPDPLSRANDPFGLGNTFQRLGLDQGFGPFPADVDPLAPEAGASTASTSPPPPTVYVSIRSLNDVAEWYASSGPGMSGAFRVTATNSILSSTPTTVTVGLTTGGTATETVDYGSGYCGSGTLPRSVSITIPANTYEAYYKDVLFHAIDDSLDEPTETIRMTVNHSANYFGGGAVTLADVASGDYTCKIFTWDPVAGKHVENSVGRLYVKVGKTHQIGVQLLMNGQQRPNVAVTLERLEADPNTEAVILDDENGNAEKDSLTRTTGPDGTAYFTIRGKSSGGYDLEGNAKEVKFTAKWTNAENRPQGRIVRAGVQPAD